MSAPLSAPSARDSQPGHSVVMLSHTVRVTIRRAVGGHIAGVECPQADNLQRKLVKAVADEIARGRSVEDLPLRPLAICDLLRALSALRRQPGLAGRANA